MDGLKIHMIGVGGVGMAGLAVLLKARGAEVTGCDLARSPRTDWLERQGIAISIGQDPCHLEGADLAIVTPAVPPDAPERRAAAERGIVRFRGEVLAELASERETIAVCGSHGKTTTATWTAKLLMALGEDVAWCIGGETGDFPVARAAPGPLVVEADESDGTLALYRVATLVVTNCEYDHPDHFKSFADYRVCYDVARAAAGDVIESEALDPQEGSDVPAALLDLPLHNRHNARAAAEVALRRGHRRADVLAALSKIVTVLPDRRFQRIAEGVYTDYAHHPSEISCAIAMARRICRGKLRVLFQPHRPSRTKALLGDFPSALAGADEVVLCPTYAAFENPIAGGDVADLYRVCRERLNALFLARSCDEAWEHARNSMSGGDLTLLLGAGDIIRLVDRVRSDFGAGRADCEGEKRRIWIGQGSNTWKSDLNLSVEYVRTAGPADKPGASLGVPWMAGIPGTVGGWIRMNAGAFGHSISEVIAEVKVDGRWIAAADCGFGYRSSAIDGEIQDFRLDDAALAAARDCGTAVDFLARRRKFPSGTYGSFFKNPIPPGGAAEPVYAGRLLEAAGAKDLRVGGAYVWPEHANVIVRGEGATSSDVLALARLMRNAVYFRFGVRLEPEVSGLSDFLL